MTVRPIRCTIRPRAARWAAPLLPPGCRVNTGDSSFRTLRRVAGLQIKLNRPVSLERRYKYRSPLIKSNIRNFSAEQMSGDVLLVGRREYLEETGSGWRHLVDGQCFMLELFESRNHGNVLTNEADTKIWLEVLQQLIEGSEVMLHRDR